MVSDLEMRVADESQTTLTNGMKLIDWDFLSVGEIMVENMTGIKFSFNLKNSRIPQVLMSELMAYRLGFLISTL